MLKNKDLPKEIVDLSRTLIDKPFAEWDKALTNLRTVTKDQDVRAIINFAKANIIPPKKDYLWTKYPKLDLVIGYVMECVDTLEDFDLESPEYQENRKKITELLGVKIFMEMLRRRKSIDPLED